MVGEERVIDDDIIHITYGDASNSVTVLVLAPWIFDYGHV
jgi:hypothetical protein